MCPRYGHGCSYDSKECKECRLECSYEAGVGVVTLKERRVDIGRSKMRGARSSFEGSTLNPPPRRRGRVRGESHWPSRARISRSPPAAKEPGGSAGATGSGATLLRREDVTAPDRASPKTATGGLDGEAEKGEADGASKHPSNETSSIQQWTAERSEGSCSGREAPQKRASS